MTAGRRVMAILVAAAALLSSALFAAAVFVTAFVVTTLFLPTAPAAAAGASNCALTGDGEVLCWGDAAPARVQVTGKVVQLSSSGDSTCALTQPGEVYCWGASEAPRPPIALSPLLLIAIGFLLVGGGTTLVLLGRQGATASAASRTAAAPSLSRSA